MDKSLMSTRAAVFPVIVAPNTAYIHRRVLGRTGAAIGVVLDDAVAEVHEGLPPHLDAATVISSCKTVEKGGR